MPDDTALLDPDCRDGKCGSCVGGPCEHWCHTPKPPPAPERTPDDTTKPTCPRCGSPKWVSVSLDGGWTRRAQCVPCGAYHEPVIGPGFASRRYGDPEAVHPDYRKERS